MPKPKMNHMASAEPHQVSRSPPMLDSVVGGGHRTLVSLMSCRHLLSLVASKRLELADARSEGRLSNGSAASYDIAAICRVPGAIGLIPPENHDPGRACRISRRGGDVRLAEVLGRVFAAAGRRAVERAVPRRSVPDGFERGRWGSYVRVLGDVAEVCEIVLRAAGLAPTVIESLVPAAAAAALGRYPATAHAPGVAEAAQQNSPATGGAPRRATRALARVGAGGCPPDPGSPAVRRAAAGGGPRLCAQQSLLRARAAARAHAPRPRSAGAPGGGGDRRRRASRRCQRGIGQAPQSFSRTTLHEAGGSEARTSPRRRRRRSVPPAARGPGRPAC